MLVRLTWTPATTIGPLHETYRVYRAAVAGEFVLITTIAVDWQGMTEYDIVPPVTYDDDSVEPETTYRYRVDALDAYDHVLRSNIFEITTLGVVPPPADSDAVEMLGGPLDYLKLDAPFDVSETGYTIGGWAYVDKPINDGAVIATLFGVDALENINAIEIGFDGPNFALWMYNGGILDTQFAVISPPRNTWFYWFIQFPKFPDETGDRIFAGWIALDDTAVDVDLKCIIVGASQDFYRLDLIDAVSVGVDAGFIESRQFVGGITQVRQWTAVLDHIEDAQLIFEKDSRVAVRQAGLFSDNPMQGGDDHSDASGNDRDWSSFNEHGTVPGPNNG